MDNYVVSRNIVPDPSLLTPSELKLVDFMNDVATQIPAEWRALGIQLGLDTHALDGIKLQTDNINAAYERVLHLCPSSCTWDSIIKALKSPAVGENDSAGQKKYYTKS